MSDNNNVTEIEEGVIEGTEPIQATSSNQACTKRAATRLSMVSKQYDIDGDGVLDPAELASKLPIPHVVVSLVAQRLCVAFHINIVLTHVIPHGCFLDVKLRIEQCASSTRADADS